MADATVIRDAAASFRAMLDALDERDKLSLPIGFRDFPGGSRAERPFVHSVVLSEQRQPRLRLVSSAGSVHPPSLRDSCTLAALCLSGCFSTPPYVGG